jgi:hypothetical protein
MGIYSNPFGSNPLGNPFLQAKKRKAFFSFHFDDVMRVNVVRNAWKISHPDAPQMRSFYDSSLWESRRLEGPDALKRLIREGVGYTSAVCVLIGSDTWNRRWVRYEIARAVIDGRGLLTVHLNNIRHHVTKQSHTLGYNPLSYMGIASKQQTILSIPQYYLCEWDAKSQSWVWYEDYTLPVTLPPYIAAPAPGHVTSLSSGTAEYDYIGHDGHRNLGLWIDQAAQRVGR